MANVQYFLRFRLRHEWYGIEINSVSEVLHFMLVSELPITRSDILGIMRLHEAVIPVIDLRLYFGLTAEYSLNTPIIVAKTLSGAVGLVVDDVDNLERIDESQIIQHDSKVSRYITRVAKLPNDLLLLIDVALLDLELPIL